MAESCSLTCHVRNSDGSVVVSSLWDSLSKFFKKNRRNAIAYYFLTKDSDFLMKYDSSLSFDANGEVTIESLKKVLDSDGEFHELTDNKVLLHLNEELKKELKTSKPTYSEALDNVLRFNKANPFNKSFLATLKRNNDGTYNISVVKRTADAEYALADQIKNKLITDALMQVLEDMGLTVEFEENPTFAMKYSTENISVLDGMYSIASVLNGGKTSYEIAEIAGHFIVSAMKDNPLVQRLINLLTPEVQEAIFKEDASPLLRGDFIVSKNSAEEAAGILIGRQLIAPFNEGRFVKAIKGVKKTLMPIKNILHRIANKVRGLFGLKTTEDYDNLVYKAEKIASTVAQGFIANSNIDIAEGLSSGDTYMSAPLNKKLADETRKKIKYFNDIIGDLKSLVKDLRVVKGRSVNSDVKGMYKNLESLLNEARTEFSSQMNLSGFADDVTLAGMIYLIQGVTDILDNDVRSLLDSIQPADRVDMYNSIVRNAKNMMAANVTVKKIAQISQILNNELRVLSASKNIDYDTSGGVPITGNLQEAVDKLNSLLVGYMIKESDGSESFTPGLMGIMTDKRRQIFVDAVKDIWGEETVDARAGILWKNNGWLSIPKLVHRSSGEAAKAVEDFIDCLDEDISFFDRFLKSAADSSDFVTGIGYKATRFANMTADRTAAFFWDKVDALEMQMLDLFGHTNCRMFYETFVDEDGRTSLTGNMLSRVNLGAWENKRNAFKKQLKKDFNDYLKRFIQEKYEENIKEDPNFVLYLNDFEKSVLYHEFVDEKWKEWHEENSIEETDEEGSVYYKPDPELYRNEQWYELFGEDDNRTTLQEKQLKFFSSVLELKGMMDSLLPERSTTLQRAPQIQGRYSHRFRNIKKQYGSSTIAAVKALRKKILNFVIPKTDESYMYGTDNEFNELAEDPLENVMYFEKEKIDRLPIYGVNKLKDMTELSTDLFGALINYGHMAATYGAMEKIVDIFELGLDVLKNRKVEGTIEKNRRKPSRSYGRYLKMLHNNVYGIHNDAAWWDKRGIFRKFTNQLTSMAVKLFLGGNVPGGAVNLGTGMVEIFKEAAAGENFNMEELLWAHEEYYSDLFESWTNNMFTNMLRNPQRPTNKNALWIRHWNIRSDNPRFYRDQRYDAKALSLLDNRLWEWYGHSIMLPYSCGDHYMQTLPYYAMGKHQKVYDHEGHEMSLMDAYDIVEGDDVYEPLTDEERYNGEEAKFIGTTHRKLQLRDGIFKNAEDIDKYDLVREMQSKVRALFESNPKLKKRTSISLDLFTDEEKRYLINEGMAVPTTVGELEKIDTALEGKARELLFGEDDEAEFMDKCRNICNRLHGIYNVEDRTPFQQMFFGNMLMAMRGYALGMINRRYSASGFNVPQRKAVEGSNVSLSKVLAYPLLGRRIEDMGAALRMVTRTAILQLPLFGHIAFILPKFNAGLKADMVRNHFTEHQYYNIRRAAGDHLVLWTLYLGIYLSSPGKHFGLSDDDDEDDKGKDSSVYMGLMYYMFNRWFREQAAFNLTGWVAPGGVKQEATQLLDYVPVGVSGAYAMFDILNLFVKAKLDEMDESRTWEQKRENSDIYYQKRKEGRYEQYEEKWKSKFLRQVPYYKSWYTITHGYDAHASYEYGRRIRGR